MKPERRGRTRLRNAGVAVAAFLGFRLAAAVAVVLPVFRFPRPRGPSPPSLHGRELPHGILPYLAEDVAFVLDKLEAIDRADPLGVLTGRLDLARLGALGPSLGGIVVARPAASNRGYERS